jgi:hypothetical protein
VSSVKYKLGFHIPEDDIPHILSLTLYYSVKFVICKCNNWLAGSFHSTEQGSIWNPSRLF